MIHSAVFCEGFVARDKVQLKNGRLLEGIISQQTDEYITIAIEGGAEIKISRDTIQYIKSASLESI
ncbi:hypothetical protein RZS08_63560, partial [Arthrospira platensis SPKY1]|nr:hypothetical protein [Arthrospira platensis SPKY1]